MSPLDFIVNMLQEHQFAFLFPATVIEGPIVTIIASFLASTGVLKLWPVFLIVLAGDFAGDLFYYWLGRLGRLGLLDKYGKYFGVERRHVEIAEQYLKQNSFKAMLAAKISHAVGLAMLFGIGMLRMNFSRFAVFSLSIGLPKTAAFVGIGYFFGGSYQLISQYLNISGSILLFFVSFFIVYKVFHYLKWRNSSRAI